MKNEIRQRNRYVRIGSKVDCNKLLDKFGSERHY